MLSSKRHSLPSRPEPPKWDSIHQDIEGAADDDVAFSYFSLRREGNLADESAASFETQISPEDDDDELTEKNANGATQSTSGLRQRFGEVIASPTAIDVTSAISNVMAAASDALHKQKTPSVDVASEDASASSSKAGLAGEEKGLEDDAEAAAAAAAAAPSKAKVEETYRRVVSFLEANLKLGVMLGKREEKKLFDQSFESVGEGRDEDFLDPVDDDDDDNEDDGDNDDDEDMFRDDDDEEDEDSMAITSLGGLAGGDTIAECSHYLPKDKQDNFQDLVSKLDKLKGELTVELAGLMEKTSAT